MDEVHFSERMPSDRKCIPLIVNDEISGPDEVRIVEPVFVELADEVLVDIEPVVARMDFGSGKKDAVG